MYRSELFNKMSHVTLIADSCQEDISVENLLLEIWADVFPRSNPKKNRPGGEGGRSHAKSAKGLRRLREPKTQKENVTTQNSQQPKRCPHS